MTDGTHEDEVDTTVSGGLSDQDIREKIVHLLSIYPIISPTMLQGGLGPYVKPKDWRPVLAQLIDEGIVQQVQETHLSPGGRYNAHNKISLVQGAGSLSHTYDEES